MQTIAANDDSEVVTEEWVRRVLPATTTHGKSAEHKGRFGRIDWQGAERTFLIWLNGSIYPADATRGDLRLLAAALQIQLKEDATK